MLNWEIKLEPFKPAGLLLAGTALQDVNQILQTIALILSIVYAIYKLYQDNKKGPNKEPKR